MRPRIVIGAVLVLGLSTIATLAAVGMTPVRQAALVDFTRPTIIAGAIVTGQVVFVHDEAKMMRGEPCTTVYRYERGRQGTKVVEFMCRPTQAAPAENFTARCARGISAPDVLQEYQFKGDSESHGVPWRP